MKKNIDRGEKDSFSYEDLLDTSTNIDEENEEIEGDLRDVKDIFNTIGGVKGIKYKEIKEMGNRGKIDDLPDTLDLSKLLQDDPSMDEYQKKLKSLENEYNGFESNTLGGTKVSASLFHEGKDSTTKKKKRKKDRKKRKKKHKKHKKTDDGSLDKSLADLINEEEESFQKKNQINEEYEERIKELEKKLEESTNSYKDLKEKLEEMKENAGSGIFRKVVWFFVILYIAFSLSVIFFRE